MNEKTTMDLEEEKGGGLASSMWRPLSEAEWQVQSEGINVKAARIGTAQLRLVEILEGAEHENWCERGHLGYVLSGEMDLEFVDSQVRLKEGSCFRIPYGFECRHRPRAATDRVVLFLIERVDPDSDESLLP